MIYGLLGVTVLIGLVTLMRHVAREQREFDARLDEQRAVATDCPPRESDGGYVPIYELEF